MLEVDGTVVDAALHAAPCHRHGPCHFTCIRGESALDDATRALPLLGDALPLLRDVGNDSLGGIRGRRRAKVGDQVHEGHVLLVPDRRHDGDARGDHGADEALIAEGQEILDTAATARDDDDLHVGVPVEVLERLDDGRHCCGSLHRHLADDEVNTGPSQPRVDGDVAQCGARATRDEADAARQEGQGALAFRCEESLGLEERAQALEFLEQCTSADGPDLASADLQ